ncbi:MULTISPECIES: sugar ABC transporter substrate-binding protein [unclassified Oceanispirochaeta]|uniref:ABC transporter substrate-binding protein n=1 Tax=unclassified Oceanispirochaeta TaxID=2635722 RepID=UPI001E2A5E90|nr:MULTISPECIES: sugar ABC transporter substrate-binding protein [unclassified Oceanispirochaeta]
MAKMNKVFMLGLIFCVAGFSLFAGGQQDAAGDGAVSLTFFETMTSPGRTATIQGIIDDYKAANPGAEINLISPPYEQADNKLTLMLTSNQDLDVVEVRDHTIKQFVNNGKLMDLSGYLKDWDEAGDLLPLANSAARTVDNTPYLIPQFFFVKALFVRTDILKQYGYDTMPATMEEMYEMAIAISGENAAQFGFGFRGKGSSFKISDVMILSDLDNIDPANVYKTSDGKFSFNNDVAREAVANYVDLFRNAVPSDGINWGFNEQVNAFISGTTPFLIQDPDTVALVNEQLGEENYTVIPIPVGKSGRSYLDYGFAGLGIPSYTKKADEAWDFISYMTGAEKNAEFCKAYGPLPIHGASYASDPYFSSGVYKAWETTMSDTDTYSFIKYPLDSPKYPGWAQVQEQYMQSLLIGEITVDEAIAKWSGYWEY